MVVYLDYNATTPMDPRAFEAMKPYFLEEFGNAGSRTHSFGQRAKAAVDNAREQVANILGAKSEEVLFTSGATESNNLALLGVARWGERHGKKHIISTTIEHKAVLEPLTYLKESGFDVELAPVTRGGYVEPEEIQRRLRKDTLLVSVMHANNETGVLQPIREIGSLIQGRETFFHVDAAQTFGKEVDDLRGCRCDFVSVSGHKIYGPKGVGALVVRRRGADRRPVLPLTFGGGQEMGIRPGTLAVPLIVGLGCAADLASREYHSRREVASSLKKRLLSELSVVRFHANGSQEHAQSHVLNVCILGVDSEALMVSLRDDVAFSNGSACTSQSYTPSHVLKAMGLLDDEVACSVRLSWGAGIAESTFPSRRFTEAIRFLQSP